MTRTELASVDPVKVLAEAIRSAQETHGVEVDGSLGGFLSGRDEARAILAAMPDYTIVRRDLLRQMNAELRQMSSRLDEQGADLTPEPAESGMLAAALQVVFPYTAAQRNTELAQEVLAASPALRARIAVAPDESRKLLAEIVNNNGFNLATDPDSECFFCGEPTDPIEDHDFESECWVTRARALLAEPKPASPAVEGE